MVEPRLLGQRRGQRAGVDRRERFEHERAVTPFGPALEQLETAEAEQDHRPRGPAVEVVDQVEERAGRPVDVLEDQDDRRSPRERLEQAAKRPETLAAVERRRVAQALGDPLRVCLICERGLEVARLAEDLEQREQRHPLAVGDRPPGEHLGAAAHTSRELLDEPRLPDARLADHDQPARGLGGDRVVEPSFEPLELRGATDEGQLEMARERLRGGIEPKHAKRAGLVRNDVDRCRDEGEGVGR